MSRPPDHNARQKIEQDLHVNLMVDASAGSGKTQSLSLRMAAGLLSGDYQIEQMAAVTFTRKAAAELRGRLQLVLERALSQEEDPQRRQRGAEALRDLEAMFVGTIHSFCARLLREYPVEAGVSPGFRELDQPGAEQLRTAIYRRILDEQTHRNPRLLRELNESGVRPADLTEALATVCANPEVHYPAREQPRPDTAPVWEQIDRFALQLRRILPEPIHPKSTCKVQKKAQLFLRRLKFANRESMFGLVHCLEPWQTQLGVTQMYWADTPAERKARSAEALELAQSFVDQVVSPFLRQWRAYLYALSMTLLTETRDQFAEVRRRTAQLDFGDLLMLSARVLRENLFVRRQLQGKFRWLFVDEFQDTDPVQAEVVFLLAATSDYVGKDWTEAPVRPGSLFIVGDPKQSIYRFRRADIDTYNLVKDRIQETGGQVLNLTASFRSLPVLCDWTNQVFRCLLPAESTPGQAPFSGLEAVRVPSEGTLAGIYTLTDHSDKYRNVAANEAFRLARLIQAAVHSGDYQWGHFLVLTFRKAEVAHYARALEQLRIPVETTGGSPEESDWLGALKGLLAALGDPQDSVATVGVLRGPLFGLSDEELYLHRQAGGSFSLLSAPYGQGHGPVLGALQTMHRMHGWTRELPAGAATERILEETGLLAMATTVSPGDGHAPGLLQLADQVRRICLEGRSLAQALRDLELLEGSLPVSLNTGRHNVVRVMNLHQAKGLQAPVVFLVAPTGGFPSRASHRVLREEGQAIGYLSIRNRYRTFAQPADWENHEQVEIQYLDQERTRLLYVAATRARDVLVVSRWSGTHRGPTRPWQPFEPFLQEAEELPWTELEAAPTPTLRFSLEEANQANLDRSSRWSEARRPGWTRTAVTGHNLATDQQIAVSTIPIPDAVLESERKDAGTAWGTLIHRLLEQVMQKPDLNRDRLERLARWYVFEEPELGELVPLAVDTVFEVMKTAFWQKAMEAGDRLVEIPFGVRVEDGGIPQLLFGVLDLALRGEEGWDLVDYKTDRKQLDQLVETYAGQVEQYARHWAAIAGEPVQYAGLFGVRGGRLSRDVRGEG